MALFFSFHLFRRVFYIYFRFISPLTGNLHGGNSFPSPPSFDRRWFIQNYHSNLPSFAQICSNNLQWTCEPSGWCYTFFYLVGDSSEGVKFIFHLTFLCCFTGLAEREVERQTSGDCFEIGLNRSESSWFEHYIELNWIRTLWMFWCVELQYFADLVFLCYHDMSWLDKGRYIRLSI